MKKLLLSVVVIGTLTGCHVHLHFHVDKQPETTVEVQDAESFGWLQDVHRDDPARSAGNRDGPGLDRREDGGDDR